MSATLYVALIKITSICRVLTGAEIWQSQQLQIFAMLSQVMLAQMAKAAYPLFVALKWVIFSSWAANTVRKLQAKVLDENGASKVMTMGCYGIGVSRVVAAAIEQNHDDKGIIWPQSIAPFDVALAPINMQKSERLAEAAESLYQQLTDAGLEVLMFDQKERLGSMLANIELIGIPHRLVLGERGLDDSKIEYKGRRDEKSQEIPLDEIVDFLKSNRS